MRTRRNPRPRCMVAAMTTSNPFGDLENKDLASDDYDVKDDTDSDPIPALPPAPAAEGEVLVEMIHHDIDPASGENLLPGESYAVAAAYADVVVAGGRARYLS